MSGGHGGTALHDGRGGHRGTALHLLIPLLMCVVLIAGALLVKRPVWQMVIDIGAEGPFIAEGETARFHNFFLFHEPETGEGRSFRWTGERGALSIPSVQRLEPLHLSIVACGCRPDGSVVPVTLLLNNQSVASWTAANQWVEYDFIVPQGLPHPEYGLMVELRAPTWRDQNDRPLGLAVDQLVLRQPAPVPLSDLPSALIALVGVLIVAWRQRTWLPPLLLTLGWIAVGFLYQPQLLGRSLLLTIFVAGLSFLWWSKSSNPASTAPTTRHSSLVTRYSSLVTVIIAVWLVLSTQVLGGWMIDDAYISFRYAQNLILGHGLVFNLSERVEGYTNFLWTVIIGGLMAVGIEPVVGTTVLTLGLAFVLVLLTTVLSRQLVPPRWVWIAPLLVALSSPVLAYTSRGSGLETGLFGTLLLLAVVTLFRHAWSWAGVCTALLMATRPDGVLWGGMAGLYALWYGWRNAPTLQRRLRPLLLYTGPLLLLFVPYFAWRWSYYGYPLPNTFYAKVGGTTEQLQRGLLYLWTFGRDHLLLFAGAVATVLGLWATRREQQVHHAEVLTLAVFVTGFSGYTVIVGGDWMPEARFFMPLVALLAVLVAWGCGHIAERWRRTAPLVLGGSLALAAALAFYLPATSVWNSASTIWSQHTAVRRYREVGRYIKLHAPADAWLATGVAGALPFYAERETIDILGLTDLHTAHQPFAGKAADRPGHEKVDPDYVLGRRPDIIPYKGSSLLWEHPAFQANYASEVFDGPEGQGVQLFVRKDVRLVGR